MAEKMPMIKLLYQQLQIEKFFKAKRVGNILIINKFPILNFRYWIFINMVNLSIITKNIGNVF